MRVRRLVRRLPKDTLRSALLRYFSAEQLAKIQATAVGIAGAGGLGSNVAMILARSGVEKMTLLDCDVVEASNLNRQHYWPRHLGLHKTRALASILREINPHMLIRTRAVRLRTENLPEILGEIPIWVEALDGAETKAMFVREAVKNARLVVAASGICGCGGAPMREKWLGNLCLVGDFQTGLDKAPPLAPRVMQAAAMMADRILEFLLRDKMADSLAPKARS